MPRSSR